MLREGFHVLLRRFVPTGLLPLFTEISLAFFPAFLFCFGRSSGAFVMAHRIVAGSGFNDKGCNARAPGEDGENKDQNSDVHYAH